eukprot:2807395-Rhodomonas_salina.1
MAGGFTCNCVSGYTGDGVTCSDIDECEDALKCDQVNADCSNVEGGFDCSCKVGYNSSDGGVKCFEVHECDLELD